MKKSLTLILLVFFCICGYAQTIDPVLRQEMGQKSDDEKIKVVVIMKSQYDRQQLNRRAAHYVTRADRREFVVNELKQFAEATQYDLRKTLAEMESQDMTTAPKIIWMANAMYFSATKQAINDLAIRRDIGIIGLDEEKYVLFDEESRPASNTREITSNVTQVNADQVWDLGYTGQGVVVAVIDTGVNYNHLDLADHLWDGGAEYPHHGYDFYNNDNDPMDDHSHGTHCAGTVCGDGTAGSQTGMAPDATLMCVKVLSSGGNGSVAVTCNAMQWAVEQGCDLFSMSLGWPNSTITERTLFRNTCAAILDAGVVGAIAAGNEGDEQYFYPIPNNVRVPGSCPPPYMDPIQAGNEGGLSCAICVGAVDVTDNAAYFTSRGPVAWSNTEFGDYPYTAGSTTDFGLIRPDVCAPGVSIKSADYSSTTGYSIMSGTSMATPCTAGCISLLLSKNINATPEEICQVLEETAVPLAEGKSNTYGYGRIDVLAAINAMYSGPLTLDSFTVNDSQGNNDGKLNAGESVTLSLTLTNESELALNGATMTLTSESEYVTITDGSESLPSFNVGQTRTINNMFAFTLSNDAPSKRNVYFTAEIFAGGESLGTLRISVMVYGHILKFEEVTVLNDNNGNGSLEAGETANLHVVISNVGNDPAASVVGALSTAYPYLTINSNNKSFGSIDVGEQASANYSVTLSGNAPDGYTIDFSLDLVDANQKHTNLEFELWRKAITLTSNPAGAGTLTGGGYFGQGQTCTITASPNDGYAFVSWTLNGTVVSYLATYSFTVTGDAEYVANYMEVTNGITIGDAIYTNSYLPIYSYYPYTLSQQIYTAAELNSGATEISSVSFFNTGSYSMTRNFTIYMVNTSKNTFESSTDWIPVTEVNQVFSGTTTLTGRSWTTVYFNTPFLYDGTSNLALVINDKTGNWNSGTSCRTFDSNGTQAIRITGTSSVYDPTNPSNYSGTLMEEKNQIILGIPSYDFTVTVTANNDNYGSVSGGEGMHYYGQPVTLNATANEGYCFYNWTENGTVVSSNATYTFPVTGNKILVGNFGEPLSITVSANPTEGGSVSGAGSYDYGTTATITATANPGYVFSRWTVNGSTVSYLSTYSFAVTSEAEYVAEFEWVSNGIAIGDAPTTHSCLPSYSFYNYTLSQQIYTADEIGMPCEITSVSFFNAGYQRTLSYTIYMKHTDKTSFNNSYDWITVTEADTVFTGSVTFVANDWTSIAFDKPFMYDGTSNLALIVDDNTGTWSNSMSCRAFDTDGNQAIYTYSDGTNYDPINPSGYYGNCVSVKNQIILGFPCTVTASANPTTGGTVSGSGTYGMGATCTLTATPNEGYMFVSWTENGEMVSSESTYSFTVSGDRNLVANFADEGSMCRIVFDLYDSYGDSWNGNYLVVDYGNGQTEQLTINSGSFASYSRVVATNGLIALSWISGYYIGECSFDIKFENGVPIYHGENLSSNYYHELTINCDVAYAPHTITAVANPVEGGIVEGAGTYIAGTVITLTATPNQNYTFMYWTENGATISSDPTYSFLVSADRSFVAHFSLPLTISVTTNMTGGGTVTGGGTYIYGTNCTLTATPNPGYVFNKWTKNGETISCLSSCTVSITEPGTYVANFQQVDDIAIGEATYTNYYLPSYTYYPYSLTQQIYTAGEMGSEATNISYVSFFNTSYARTRNLAVYMVNTDKTSFENTNDWIAVTDADLMFSGSVSLTGYGWANIYFDTMFAYDGVSNVALIVVDNTGSWYSGLSCRTFDADGNQAIRTYGSGTNFDPANPYDYTGTLMSMKNQVIFGIPTYEYTVTATANPTEGGTISGNEGLYYLGQSCTLTATPNPGYGFFYWKENGSIKSYNPVYTFHVTGNMQLEAYFGVPIAINVSASPSEGGTVSGGGEFGYNQQCTLTATPNEGYLFTRWVRNGSVVSCLPTYTFSVTSQGDYVAQFRQIDDNSIAIGEPTSTSSYLPTYTYYPYSLTQQIYTADELNTGACEISSVTFFNAGYGETRNLTIYMVNTDKTSFDSSTDWIPVTEADRVFSGNLSTNYRNWITVYFNTAFQYDGYSNVALIVDDNTNYWYGSTYCRTFDTETTQAIRICGDEVNYDPMSPNNYAGTLMSVKNQVIFGIPIYEYTLEVSATPFEGGIVSGGGGLYFYGQPVPITATANEGYVFDYWTRYNENYGYDEVVSYLSPDNVPVTGDIVYVANFEQMDGIIIGEPTHTNYYLPDYNNYPYAMSQQIYTANELSHEACDISSVSFFNTGYYSTRNLNVYMVNTDKTQFNSSIDWITVSEEDMVFSGFVDLQESGWATIYFNTPFSYDGFSNVALIINDVTGEWVSSLSCRTFETEAMQAIYVVGYDDYYGYEYIINPYQPNLYNGTRLSEKNQVVFGIADFQYMVTLTANPEEGGTLTGGGGPFYYGQPIIISATPNEGYVFDNWTTYNEEYGYYEEFYFSTESVSVMGTTEYTANFEQMDGIVIGEAAHSSWYLPVSDYYYTLTQQIYTADELNSDACEISSVSFYNTSYGTTRTFDIYMVNTSKTTFASYFDRVPFTEADRVFSGSVTVNGYGWMTIYFETPFNYDGDSNVALIINDVTGNWNYGIYCRTFDANGNQAICAYGYNNNFDSPNPNDYYGELLSEKNQVVFGIASYDYMVTVTANPTAGGTVSGGGGPYYYGQPITVNATANEGYVFNNWTKNNEVVSYLSMGNVSVTETCEFIANFEQKDGIIIGEATYANLYLPTYANTYTMSQQIYTAAEMGGEATEISSVSFFNTTYSRSRNLDVYLVHTDKTSFESNTDWITVTEADKVFSGNITLSGYGWATIYFATPFSYNGTSNLALVIDDNTYSSYTGIKCRTFSTNENQAIYIHGGSAINFDPCNPQGYNGTLLAEKNQVVFGIPSYDYTVTVSASPSEGGTVSGGGGTYYYGQPITISATPADGYVFSNWTKNGAVVSYFTTAQISVTESAEYVANFQQIDGIAIGDAISSSSYLPMYYYYSLTEQIYTASEMGGVATDISSVSFFNTGTSSINRNLKIYMVNTNKTSFAGTNDWIPVTEANLVFSGNVTMTNRSWVTIYFNTPFAYDGTSNVALIVDDNSNSYNSYTNCRTFNTDSNQAIRISGSGTDYDPYNPQGYTGTLMSVKNQVVFGIPTYEYMVTVSASPEVGGTVSGGNGGLYFYNQPINLTATPNDGYVFFNWTKNGEVISYFSNCTVSVTESAEYVANFQPINGIVVGDAIKTNSYLPTYSYYPYTLSQQIYTADELGGEATTFYSLSFFNTGTAKTRNLSVYMVLTNKTVFGSTSDWITVTEADLVYSGNVNMVANGWASVVLNAPFAYDGTSNIALVVDDNTGNWNSGLSCRTFNTGTYQALRVTGSGTNYDPYAPSSYSGTLMMEKNQVIFHWPSSVTVSASPANGGTVIGSGSYAFGSTCTVSASPNPGYYFLNWTVNDVVVSYDAAYTFTVNGDTDLVAHFVAGWSTCTITFDLYDSYSNGWSGNYLVVDYGDGSPEQLTLPSGSSISYSRTIATGSNITLSWISGSNTYQCSFDVRFENGVPIYHGTGLSSSFHQELTINCAVATAPHTITADVVPEEGGTVEGTGTYDGGTVITLTATPNAGYAFCYWAENGVTVSTDANYTFTVTADRDLVARFSLPINISVTNNLAEGGTTTGDGVYYYGNTCTLTATPNEGYLFLNWSKNGEVVSCNSTYSFTVTEDADFEAVFMLLEGTLIGSGEATNGALPSTSYYCYTLSQQIYTPDEIGTAGSITSISYYNAGYTKTRSYSIYMVHTDKSTFSNSYDWITVSEADLVYSGSVTMTKGYWNTITLDTPFAYNGTSNLAIIIDDNTGSWTSNSMTCRVFNANGNQAIYIYSDGTNYDPYNPSGYNGTRQSMKNQIILDFDESGTQTIELVQGWNWFSTNVDITLDDLKAALVTALPGTPITIKSKTQNTAYTPNTNQWRGSLTTLDVTQMYMINVNTDCAITLIGDPVNLTEHPVIIQYGANWIAFPLAEKKTLNNTFAGFAVNGDVVKSKTGNASFNGTSWRGNLNTLEPGRGYIYISNVHGIRYFVFPSNGKKK